MVSSFSSGPSNGLYDCFGPSTRGINVFTGPSNRLDVPSGPSSRGIEAYQGCSKDKNARIFKENHAVPSLSGLEEGEYEAPLNENTEVLEETVP